MSEVNLDPIAWWWNPNVDAKTLGGMLDNNQGRLVSLDVFFAGGEQRLVAVWVSNTGNQNQAWWWNPNVDAATLGKMLEANKGRLVVLVPFVIIGKQHFAAVWVSNTGPNAQAWWWNPDVDPATLGQMLEANKGRLTTLSTYKLGAKRRYAAVWVSNTGPHQQAWWWNPDVDGASLGEMLRNNSGRLVSLDPFMVDGKLRYAAVWVSNTAQAARTWWWYHGLDGAALGKKFDQFCAYPIDLKTYAVGQKRLLSCAMNSYPPGPDPSGAKLIEIEGTGSLVTLKNNIAPLDEDLSLSLNLKNATTSAVKVTEAELLLTQTGGWVEKYFTQPLYGNGKIWEGQSQDIAPLQSYGGSMKFGWGIGAEYFIVRLKAHSAGGKNQYSHTVIPMPRSGFSPPAGFTAPTPLFIGLWAQPAEVIPLWSGNAQTRWLTVGGQIINGSGQTARLVGWHLIFEADGKIVLDQELPMNFNHYDTKDDFKPMPPPEGGEMALKEFLAYFVYGFDVGKAPKSFSKGTLRLIANYKIGDRCGAAVCETAVVNVEPVTLAPPITGRWRWGNSPNHTSFDGHAWPHQRFSVDLVKVDENNSSIKPDADPELNESFYAYGEPVLAVAKGTVVKSVDKEDENFGQKENKKKKDINYVLIDHSPKVKKGQLDPNSQSLISGYYHLRKGKNTFREGDPIEAGEQLGEVGNSGGSSEPHLHLGYVVVDPTGRGILRPMQFHGLRTTDDKAVTGVPATEAYICGATAKVAAHSRVAKSRVSPSEPPVILCNISNIPPRRR